MPACAAPRWRDCVSCAKGQRTQPRRKTRTRNLRRYTRRDDFYLLASVLNYLLPNAPLEAASSVCDLLRLREKLLLQVLEPGRRAQTHIRHLEERVQLIHTPGLNGRPELCGNLNDERPERIHQPVAIRCNWSQSVAISVNQI